MSILSFDPSGAASLTQQTEAKGSQTENVDSGLVRVFQHATLPCGSVLPNRLVKVAMYEHLASFLGGPPNEYHFRLYSEWAKYDWGMIITGNVQISKNHLSLARDMVLPLPISANATKGEESLRTFRQLSDAIHGVYSVSGRPNETKRNKTLAIMQLNHTGRQAANFLGGKLPLRNPPLAPSAIRVGAGTHASFGSKLLNALIFQVPKEMSESDVVSSMDAFVQGAIIAHRTGFDGVQLHAAHGYLLAQFLSEKSNIRTDSYAPSKALDMIHNIVKDIRSSTSSNFAICIKLNVADYLPAASSTFLSEGEKRAIQHLLTIASWGLIDVIEVSGGDYESPDFVTTSTPETSKSPRAALFSRFSYQALQTLDDFRQIHHGPVPLILLTGGLRTPGLMSSALSARHADLLGVGRGSVLCPNLPTMLRERLKNPSRWNDVLFCEEPDLRKPWIMEIWPFTCIWYLLPKLKLIGAGATVAWYTLLMRDIASASPDIELRDFQLAYERGGLQALIQTYLWITSQSYRNKTFLMFSSLLFTILGIVIVPVLGRI